MADRGGDPRRVTKQKRGVRRGREHWAGIVGEFEASGLTQRGFCERRGVRFTAFRNWVYRLRNGGPVQPGGKKRGSGFVQIVAAAPKQYVVCKLQVGRGELLFSELLPAEYLGALLRLMDR